MINNQAHRFINAAPNRIRPTIFKTPEEVFADPTDVAQRHETEIRSPAIDNAIADWNDAKHAGDDDALRAAAKAIVDATSAAFRLQGVPTYAHPVLPPQFVQAEVADVSDLANTHQQTVVAHLLDRFDASAKPGAAQQFKSLLSESANDTTRSATTSQSADNRRVQSNPFIANSLERQREDSDKVSESKTAGRDQLQTLEFDPNDTPLRSEQIDYVDENGRPVPTANPLSNGAIAPPRPALKRCFR